MDVARLREHFPTLQRQVHGRPLTYLDNAATTQRPREVIEAVAAFYRDHNANVHRGIHTLSEEATRLYEGARQKVARFIGAASPKEVIFTRNATEALNLVAWSWGRANLGPGDVVVLTEMEHHSNIVPWQLLALEKGFTLFFLPVREDGTLDLDALDRLRGQRVRLVSVVHVSNVVGTINPVQELARWAHDRDALFLLDAAQSVPHLPVNVADLGCDFLAFSGHKMGGPTGIGVLWGRQDLLEEMPPFLGGGDMIREVYLDEARWNDLPWKFEAGTPNVAGAVGLGAAVDFLTEVGMEAIWAHERELVRYAYGRLQELPGVRILGPGPEARGGVLAFWIEGIHPHDLASLLDAEGIAVRAGHHCAMPLHTRLGLPASTRASFWLYNTREEVDRFIEALVRAQELFGVGR